MRANATSDLTKTHTDNVVKDAREHTVSALGHGSAHATGHAQVLHPPSDEDALSALLDHHRQGLSVGDLEHPYLLKMSLFVIRRIQQIQTHHPSRSRNQITPTGLLAKEANTVAGTTTVLKYHEPPEARKPPAKEQWRMYVFKEKDLLDTIYLHRRSAWLLGRDEKVTDYLLEHPSVSKQHAVIQFRHSSTTNEFGDKTNKVKPYLIDLESANGTKLNGKKVSQSRFVELVDGDVVAFGDSEREYVLMLPPADAKT